MKPTKPPMTQKTLSDLQDARQQALQRIANEHFAIQQDILAGKYDDSLETLKLCL